MESIYMAKVTRSGQISIPKELRREYGIDEAEYMSIEPVGKVLVMRKIEPIAEELFDYFREEVKKKGLKKRDVDKIVERAREEVFKEEYEKLSS